MTFILLLLLLSIPLRISSANEWSQRHSSESIDINEGLPHHHIDDISPDSRGFIWISTAGGGLARYDGYEFIEFSEHSATYPLKNNFVYDSSEDSFGRLWVGSKGGIDLIDIYSLAPADGGETNSCFEEIADEEAHKIFCTADSNVWIAGNRGFFRVVLDKHSGNVASIDSVFVHQADGRHVTSLLESSFCGSALFGYDNVVFKVNHTHDSSFHNRADTLLTLPTGYAISAICPFDDKLWIGTCQGICCYDNTTGAMRYYHTDARPNSLSQDFITDIAIHRDATGKPHLVAATLLGLNIYRQETDDFEQVTSDTPSPTNHPLFRCNFINCLFAGTSILWVGTEAGGISKIYPSNLSIQNIVFRPEIIAGSSSHPVNAIHEDATGNIWAGRVEGGLTRIDRHTRHATQTYTVDSPYVTGLSHNSVSSMASDPWGRLWVGTWGGGVCRTTKPTAPETELRFTQLKANQAASAIRWEMVRSIAYDSINHYMWIAGSRIYACDLHSDTILLPLSKTAIKGVPMGCVGMSITADGLIWIATESGLLAIDLTTMKDSVPTFRLWPEVAGLDMTEVNSKHMTVAQDGSIWMATDGYGIIHISEAENPYTFDVITTADGLVDNNVRGILEADDHTIWMTTLKGISRYNPATAQFTNFTSADGVPASPFYHNAAHKGSNGILYFGSMVGVTAIAPWEMRTYTNRDTDQMAFTRIYTPERNLTAKGHDVTIHEKEKVLNVRFSSLTYNRMPAETYAYRLQGFDDEDAWTHSVGQRNATYTNLQPGRYTLQVKYAANGHNWSNHILELDVEVKPYFYKTRWFRFTALMLLILTAYAIYSWRVSSLKQQKKTLHRKVQEHTEALRLQKEELAERAQELEEKNLLLTKQNEEITRQKNEIIQMAQQQFAYSMSPDELHIPAHSPDIELLNRTLEIIKENYPNPAFEINDIINTLGVSRTVLYTKIQKLTGDSIGNLLRNYRLTMAHRLIAETQPSQSLTIAEIAYRVGFNDPKYFSRCFAKQFGCPPSKVLDENQKK